MNILDKEDRQVSLPINPDGRQVSFWWWWWWKGNYDDDDDKLLLVHPSTQTGSMWTFLVILVMTPKIPDFSCCCNSIKIKKIFIMMMIVTDHDNDYQFGITPSILCSSTVYFIIMKFTKLFSLSVLHLQCVFQSRQPGTFMRSQRRLHLPLWQVLPKLIYFYEWFYKCFQISGITAFAPSVTKHGTCCTN